MASIIDNKKRTLLESLKNSLKQAERVDILTAFFYFSGFNELAEELKDKKIRILVGYTIDPNTITELCNNIKENQNPRLERYVDRSYDRLNSLQKRRQYIESFIGLFNKSALSEEFDETESQKVFKMFMNKLNDGSLEIRLTNETDHSKAYILTNKDECSCFGDQKGTVFFGSSNFTYSGLLGQGEMNVRFSDNEKYDEFSSKFESLWNDSKAIDIQIKDSNDDFVKEIKEKLWIYAQPTPYSIFIRILFELYYSLDNSKIKTPSEISNGKFSNLKYQIDAIKYGIDCINKNNGVIIADVVGLGKSIIASAIASNITDITKTVIIAPPHLKDQWDEYQQDFGLRGVRVESSGKIKELHAMYADDKNPIIYIIDEAHRYRNELSDNYQYLHQLTRSHPNNKTILLTATPYNNRPQDLFALVKLFQTPSRSTIQSVDNLGVKFQELIAKYNRLEKEGKRNLSTAVKTELEELSRQLRLLIDPVIVRRSRIDLKEIKEYADDLEAQGIQFPEIIGPELVEYDLGKIRELYISTLERLSRDFICSRYNPAGYLNDPATFMKEYEDLFEMDLQLSQKNLANFMKRLFIMRFESSKLAFKATLDNVLKSYENIKKWWDKGYVPIKKRGYLADPDDVEIEDLLTDLDSEDRDIGKIRKNEIPFSRDLFKQEFIYDVENDIKLLAEIKKAWFSKEETGFDPKFERIRDEIASLLKQNAERKIVVFTSFADTANYIHKNLVESGFRALLYTGGASKIDRVVVRENFDASHKQDNQKNDYDIIVATDALSEGFNLNRAGIIINYDIPYNPTRVVQRIGRINRINKKMFDKIYIYNFFPTDIGEQNILIKGISTLKMLLITNIIGSDTKTLTQEENLQSYFKKQYDNADVEASEKSWDNEYRNIYNSIKHNTALQNQIMRIPERARIVRKRNSDPITIAFAKRGNNTLFALALPESKTARIVAADEILKFFKADKNEKSYEYDDVLDKKFAILREEITKPYQKIKMTKRRGEAVDNLEKLLFMYPAEKDYLTALIDTIKTYDDLSDGELKYIAQIAIKPNNLKEIVSELKKEISAHYIIQIKQKAEGIEAQTEIILFTEDLRNDNN